MKPDDPLFKALQALPRAVEPERDLWEDILPQLSVKKAPPEPVSKMPGWPVLLAAAAILAVAVGAGWLRPEAPVGPTPAGLGAADEDWSAQMATGVAVLEDTLAAQRDEMDPEMWIIVEQSLRDIDDAIGRIEAAMADRPDDPRLLSAREHLQGHRVALLRTAVNL